jgi:hypothetical protein
MNRNDTLLAIAAHCRASHTLALAVVGWYAAAAPDEELEALLKFLHELPLSGADTRHLEAYQERWGHVLGRPTT